MIARPAILITGATKGIGRALVERFAASAGELHLVARHASDLEELRTNLAAHDCAVHVYPADLSQPTEVRNLVGSLRSNLGALHVLINNAGIYLPGQLLSEPGGNLEYMMQLNVLSHYELVRGLYDKMPAGSHLIHMASVASRKLFTGKPSYSISKHAQGVMTEALRYELRPLGIRVTSVMPGPTWSASWEGVEFPEKRLLEARHIAEAVWQAWQLPPEAVMEEIVLRPFEGDID